MECKCSLAFFCLLFLSSCANFQHNKTPTESIEKVPINYNLFTLNTDSKSIPNSPFYLTEAQKDEVILEVNEKVALGIPKHIALSELLESHLSNFTYYGDTYNAETTTRLNKGNCMSLAVLTGAFAEAIELDFSYREINTIPVFDKQNNLILSSSHVQTILYDERFIPKDNHVYLSKPSVVIDYFPDKWHRVGGKLSKSNLTSMYYKNLAADALINNELSEAFNLAETAYQFDRESVAVINLLGVIHRRAGDIESAENIYKAGMLIDSSNLALMSNYIVLLKGENRFDDAAKIEEKYELLDDPDPYQWLELAYTAKSNHKAAMYYKKALKKAPYLHEAYLGLYAIYLAEGNIRGAKDVLAKKLEWTYDIEEKKLYKSKLYSLR